MRMLNQAFEDAAAFESFRDALTQRNPESERLTTENRAQRRARERAEQKLAQKAAEVKKRVTR